MYKSKSDYKSPAANLSEILSNLLGSQFCDAISADYLKTVLAHCM